MNHSARRLNVIAEALGCQSYLEIGVAEGETFLDVNVEKRTGVDPYFCFNHEAYDGKDGVRLYQTTSDEFFKGKPTEVKYSLIYIDGLHTYEQTYRDIINSLLHSHSETVILIDDTVPCDVFSTSRYPEDCIRLRHKFGSSFNEQWHGDTYKVVPLLRLFNPHYNLATITDNGNPQTLLWRSNKVNAPECHTVVKNIASLDYLWFVNNIHLYNPTTESEALSRVISQIKE